MYIKEIILEGFKSYSVRTEIKGFGQQFNAITGLNGSGKSNILDAILFLLGVNKEWEQVSLFQNLNIKMLLLLSIKIINAKYKIFNKYLKKN